MYLIAITFSLCIAYFLVFFLFSLFFEAKIARITSKSFRSIGIIVFLSFLGYIIAFSISDPELSNRVLHGFGGGFLSFLVCFLVVKDSELSINKFQFFVFSVLVVTALGVANEILEFFLQNYIGLIFSTSPSDTWLDLISNTTGIFIASAFLVPFINKRNSVKHI